MTLSAKRGRSAAHATPRTLGATSARAGTSGKLHLWLRLVAACIGLMVLVGGATRLTESGLSITEWEPLFGAIPPLTTAAWQAKFEAYKQIPQFALHPDMTLAEFRTIFFWEWTHRLIGRLLGLIIALPLAGFWIAGMLSRRLKWQLVGLLLLVGVQGAVGWWMVKSGLVGRTEVSQYRLAIHLLLATVTLAYVVWIDGGLPPRRLAEIVRFASVRIVAMALVVLVFCQIGFGALVAGLRAGLVYNTWPLMDGGLAPPASSLLFLNPAWANVFENPAMVQLQHRVMAYLLLVAAVVHAVQANWLMPGTATAWRARLLAGLVLAQAAIGITALVLVVPLAAALAHQVFAMVVLVAAVVHRRAMVTPTTDRVRTQGRTSVFASPLTAPRQ